MGSASSLALLESSPQTRPAADAIQFTLEASAPGAAAAAAPTTIDDGRGGHVEACVSCSG